MRQESAPLAIIDELEQLIDVLEEAQAYAKWQVVRSEGCIAIWDAAGKPVAVLDADRLDGVGDLVAKLWNHCHTLLPLARLGVEATIGGDIARPARKHESQKSGHLRLVDF